MVSDFDFLSAVFATPPGSPIINREWGYYRLRIASPHHSPAVAAALPEQAHAAGTPPKSLGGREKVPLSSMPLSRPACHSRVNGLRGSLGQRIYHLLSCLSWRRPICRSEHRMKYLLRGDGYDKFKVSVCRGVPLSHTHQTCPAKNMSLYYSVHF